MEKRIGDYEQSTNAGGIRRLKLLPESAVMAVLDPVQFPNVLPFPTMPICNIVLRSNAIVTEFALLPSMSGFSVAHQRTVYGDEYAVEVGWQVPKQRAEVLGWCIQNIGSRWVALLEDRNGLCYVVGDIENGLELTYAAHSGEQATSANKTAFKLAGRLNHQPWLLETIESSALFKDAAFDYSFDLSFDA